MIHNKVVWDRHYSFNIFTVRNNFFIIFQSIYASIASLMYYVDSHTEYTLLNVQILNETSTEMFTAVEIGFN